MSDNAANFEKFNKAYMNALTELHESVSHFYIKKPIEVDAEQITDTQVINTLEGDITANPTDWIVTGVNGEKYPVPDTIFKKYYEPSGKRWRKKPLKVSAWQTDRELLIPYGTEMFKASPGDFIVKQPEGSLCAIKPDIFVKTYDKCQQIKIIPIEKDNEEHLKFILEGCNLDSIASGDTLWTIEDIKNTIKENIKQFFLLYANEEVIGMCTIANNALSGFAIFTPYQGKGYGKQALAAIIKKMKDNNKGKEIVLRVAKKNIRAFNLYKSFGFEIANDIYNDKNSYIMILKP